jgi:hypothetical protein
MVNHGLMSEMPGQPSRRPRLRRWLLTAAGLIAVIHAGVAVYVTLYCRLPIGRGTDALLLYVTLGMGGQRPQR